MKKTSLALLVLCLAFPSLARAQGAAPDMFGVREVVLQYARFSDPKASDLCNLSREQIAQDVSKALAGTTVPAIPVSEAKPPMLGVARIDLVPEIYSHLDENLQCVSSVALTAQNRVNAVIPPVNTLRGVTITYWRQEVIVSSNQSTHGAVIAEVLKKMIDQFSQQYRIDQPPELPQ